MSGELLVEGRCILPGGLVLEHDRLLREAELRPLSGREEEWLVRYPAAPVSVAVTRLLSACLVRIDEMKMTPALVRRLLVGDRDYLVLQLRRLTLGDTFQATLPCPSCAAKMDLEFSADDVPVEGERRSGVFSTVNISFSGRSPRTVRFRLPTGEDQEAVLGMPLPEAVDTMLNRCLSNDGAPEFSEEEKAAVIGAMERLAPRVELELELTCPECGFEFAAPFDTTAFFLREMRLAGNQLLRETHALAFHYHWSEDEILSLRRDRRRAYLNLLRDELRRE